MAGEIQEVNSHTLEAARQVVEQEMEARWQLELRRWPSLQREEEFFASLDPSEPRDPVVIEERRAHLENRKIGIYLNNFLFHLPPITRREKVSQVGYMRWKMTEEFPEMLSMSHTNDRNSELRRGQTNQQFYENVDRAISEEHVGLDELGELGRKAEMKWAYASDQLKFNQTLLKVVTRLRAMGYNDIDLTA